MNSQARPVRKRHRHRPLKLPLTYFALAIATGLTATAAAASLYWPGPDSPALAARHEENADTALRATPVDYTRAERENEAALASAPLASTALVRRAYIIQQQRTYLSAEALDSLERSYRAAPFGPDVTPWRLHFMFENWSQLSPRLRTRAIQELEVSTRFHGGRAALLRSIESPSGRLAASLITRRVYRGDPHEFRPAQTSASAIH